ncbi:MAG TPA: succinate dehydrogenase iron-sulfur subunit [Blastocatellia bacterium]|nr:succinate dehydrogenase iron-sulfur subunit [Blastocatellia bacterium]
MPEKVFLRIKRQEKADGPSRWEEFEVPYQPKMNVLTCLQEIQRNPVTRDGRKTSPVTWDSNCLEEVCGACTMVINGKVRQGCTALVDDAAVSTSITLEPMTKFPVIRDLVVDRSRLFNDFKRAHAWIPIDGTYSLGPGPRVEPEEQDHRYLLSRCMACGCCLEVCPQYGPQSAFVGAAVLNQVRLMNTHPTGHMNRDERLEAIMDEGGITDCGNAQNCVRACPKEIPLTTSIAELYRETTWHGLFGWLKR